MDHPLDNPVWSALATGPHAVLALGRGRARHYPRGMAPFSAVEEPSEAAYADLARDLPAGCEARLFRPAADDALPPGWEELSCRPILQMVCDEEARLPPDAAEATLLRAADVDDMLALAEAAQPGPFGRDTVRLGTWLGIRRDGRLVAMAGERFRLAGFTELSGIGTAPEARRQGLATRLTARLARAALARGEIPFLHVFPDNCAAVAAYERIGFRTRATLWVLWRRPVS